MVREEGCVARLVVGLNTGGTDDGWQRAGCRAIRWLVDGKNKAGMIASGAIPALLRALDTIRTSPSLHLGDCRLLRARISLGAVVVAHDPGSEGPTGLFR